ncbi:MAG TPA: sensor histidine kinase [Streptosporangiaceae bacterium]|nr:sensor histidine kinase [Streptosporangiaceae bacterium]
MLQTGPRPPFTYRVTPRQWQAVDVAAAVVVALWAVFDLRLRHGFRIEVPPLWPGLLGAAATLPVAVRRRWPLPVLAVVTSAVAVLTALGRAQLDLDIMLAMAIYTVAAASRRPVAVAALVGTETALIIGILTAAASTRGPVDTAHSVLTAGALWFVGDSVRERRRYLAEEAALRQRQEAERGRLAVREERVRIARELHDVVAHTLSVVTFQAGVGRKIGATRPDQALTALRAVEVTGRGALEELRRILGLLRDDDGEGPSLAPAPGVGNLEELAGMVRAAGIPVTLAVTGDVAALPPAASLTAYRIVQEALTNVVKHAPGATATARVQASRDGVLITVDNGRGTGSPETQPGGARHGLVGMTERAAAFGGTLDAGPAAGGGFQVTAFLPLASPSTAGPASAGTGSVGQVA